MPYFIDTLSGKEASIRQHSGTTLAIGRGTNADLRLDDASVALEHAVIEQDDGGWTIRDRGSVTGTFVNDRRVDSTRLADGDRVDIGVFSLTVEILSAEDPLFLHVARLDEEAGGEASALALGTLKAESGDLLAMVDATRRLRAADAGAEDSFVTLAAATLRLPQEPRPPAPAAPAEAPAPATPRTAPPPEVPRVDYARAYRLERGLLKKSVLTAVLALATAGALLALFERGRQDVFSPGPLTSVHRSVTANACGACHSGWRPVADRSCQTSTCHDAVGVHQTVQLRDPSCLECHTEHRDLQALRLLREDGGCVECHGELSTSEGASSFASKITGFGADEHPGFTPRTDPGALSFHHEWHLTKVKRGGTLALGCVSCHRRDDEGEIEPVVFEEHCQECHNLSFDRRFGAQEAPHATPAEVLTYLAGFYSLRPEVLGRLEREERRLLGGGLRQEEQLARVAEWNARALLRNKCLKCHQLTADPSRARLSELDVEPPKLRLRWLDHAAFLHRPHLELDMACDDCHATARASKEASDVLLPAIDGCRDCHRPARPGESPATATLGRIDCVGCHTYHPEPGEEGAIPRGHAESHYLGHHLRAGQEVPETEWVIFEPSTARRIDGDVVERVDTEDG